MHMCCTQHGRIRNELNLANMSEIHTCTPRMQQSVQLLSSTETVSMLQVWSSWDQDTLDVMLFASHVGHRYS